MPVLGQFSPRVESLELLNTLYNNIDIVCRLKRMSWVYGKFSIIY